MDPFFIYVSIGALVLLILILTVVGVAMTQLRSLDPFPPTMNACPDYWDVSSNPLYCGVPIGSNITNLGNIAQASNKVDDTNSQNVGMCTGSGFGCRSATYLELDSTSTPINNFQYVKLNGNTSWSTLYPGMSERCAQRSWAQTMNLTWDGVSNYNGC